MGAVENEATRLEELWAGGFGDDYVERNANAPSGRGPFWADLLTRHAVRSALEVGCNIGGNLQHVRESVDPRGVVGIDVNEKALAVLRQAAPDVNALWSRARDLPFRDGRFDLTFTVGVLIHQPQSTLPLVMSEIVRCSSRLVLSAEYEADELTEVHYRGHEGALFKQPFGQRYLDLFPELERIDGGFLPKEDGAFDDVTWHLFRKRDASAGATP